MYRFAPPLRSTMLLRHHHASIESRMQAVTHAHLTKHTRTHTQTLLMLCAFKAPVLCSYAFIGFVAFSISHFTIAISDQTALFLAWPWRCLGSPEKLLQALQVWQWRLWMRQWQTMKPALPNLRVASALSVVRGAKLSVWPRPPKFLLIAPVQLRHRLLSLLAPSGILMCGALIM